MPFRFGKGSRAASEGASRKHKGAVREQRGSRRENLKLAICSPSLLPGTAVLVLV